MKRVLAMGLMGALLALVGCGQKSTYDPWAGDRKTANPPPTPPDCPAFPELANVTRGDGSIIDVRIIQIDDVKLYVPRSWMGNLNYAEDARFYTKIPSAGGPFGRYDPDLSDVECPGVVHKWVSQRAIFDLWFNFVIRRSNAKPWIMPNFTLETKVDNLTIVRPRGSNQPKYATSDMYEEGISPGLHSSGDSAHIVLVPNLLIGIYPWPKDKPIDSPGWIKTRADVIGLFNWLRTPPKNRDNNRIFNLGAE